MTENQKMGLIAYFRGFISMMDKCATGANIHATANVKQSLLMMIQMLEHPTKYQGITYEQARKMTSDSVGKAKQLWREWSQLQKPQTMESYGAHQNGEL